LGLVGLRFSLGEKAAQNASGVASKQSQKQKEGERKDEKASGRHLNDYLGGKNLTLEGLPKKSQKGMVKVDNNMKGEQ